VNDKKRIKHLLVLIALCIVVILILIYAYLKGSLLHINTWKTLIESLIPELLGTLIPFLAIYYFLIRQGIDTNNYTLDQRTEWLTEGFESYSDISWSSTIQESNKIIFCAFYIDNWIETNMQEFKDFLCKKNTKFTVYLPDYNNIETLENINKIIPAHTTDNLKVRIIESISKIKKIIKQENIKKNKVQIFLYPHVFNYTFESFDKKIVYLSINEICRTKNYQSPFFKIDLSKSSNITKFYNDEIEYLNKNSSRYNL